jgi:hypothetical protein
MEQSLVKDVHKIVEDVRSKVFATNRDFTEASVIGLGMSHMVGTATNLLSEDIAQYITTLDSSYTELFLKSIPTVFQQYQASVEKVKSKLGKISSAGVTAMSRIGGDELYSIAFLIIYYYVNSKILTLSDCEKEVDSIISDYANKYKFVAEILIAGKRSKTYPPAEFHLDLSALLPATYSSTTADVNYTYCHNAADAVVSAYGTFRSVIVIAYVITSLPPDSLKILLNGTHNIDSIFRKYLLKALLFDRDVPSTQYVCQAMSNMGFLVVNDLIVTSGRLSATSSADYQKVVDFAVEQYKQTAKYTLHQLKRSCCTTPAVPNTVPADQ